MALLSAAHVGVFESHRQAKGSWNYISAVSTW